MRVHLTVVTACRVLNSIDVACVSLRCQLGLSHLLSSPLVATSAHSASLRLGQVLLKFLLSVDLRVLFGKGCCHDFVKCAVIALAAKLVSLCGPCYFVSVAIGDLCWILESFIRAVNDIIDLQWNFFQALFRHMSHFEGVLRSDVVQFVCDQSVVILCPELLSLLEKDARLNWRGFFSDVL